MLLWRSGGRSRDIRGSMAKVHYVASFNCIPIKIVKFVNPDNVRIFLKNLPFQTSGEGQNVSEGWGYEKTVMRFVLKYE